MPTVFERDSAGNRFVASTITGYRVKLGPLPSAQQIRDARALVAENDKYAANQNSHNKEYK